MLQRFWKELSGLFWPRLGPRELLLDIQFNDTAGKTYWIDEPLELPPGITYLSGADVHFVGKGCFVVSRNHTEIRGGIYRLQDSAPTKPDETSLRS